MTSLASARVALVTTVLLSAALVLGVDQVDRATPVVARPEGVATISSPHGEANQTVTIAFGGDVSLALEINAYAADDEVGMLRELSILERVDLAIANLEGVVANVGDAGAAKSDTLPHYFRGRPETINVLRAAGIDALGTANNHVGDYGDAALLEQGRLLDAAGIAHAGSGENRGEACAPTLIDVRGIRVALFAVGSTEPLFAASAAEAGTCFIGLDDDVGWESTMPAAIAGARDKAHVVLVSWHAGRTFETEPTARETAIARRLVDLGADAVLGSSAHVLQGLEVHSGRPIVHDAGNLLMHFDRPYDAAVFLMTISTDGVERVEAVPVISAHGYTRLAAGADAERILIHLVRSLPNARWSAYPLPRASRSPSSPDR
jgi:hypothetical protein